MSYIPAQQRVRFEFTKEDCDQSRHPPDDLELRMLSKLDSEIKKGNLESYLTFMDRLKGMWKTIRKSKQDPETLIAVTLANGCPPMPEVVVKPGRDAEALGFLTINATPEIILSWRLELFQFKIKKSLLDLKIQGEPSYGQLHGIFLDASEGMPTVHKAINPCPAVDFQSGNYENIDLITEVGTQNIVVAVRDIKTIADDGKIHAVLKAVEEKAHQMSERSGVSYEILKDHLVRRLQSANRGPERYGFDLPITLLAARVTESPAPTKAGSIEFSPRKKSKPKAAAGLSLTVENIAPYFNVEVSANAMSANLSITNPKIFELPFDWTPKILLEFVQSTGVIHGLQEDAFTEIVLKIHEHDAFKDHFIAKGEPAIAGDEPFLYPSYQHQVAEEGASHVDMRQLQQRTMVKKGQLVAEVRYRSPAVDGKDVRGEVVAAPTGPSLAVTVGDRIKADGTKYFATAGGVPEVGNASVQMTDCAVHSGHVDLKTGDIEFDGDLHIGGNIEVGATVRVGKNLTISGMIQGGSAIAGGTITAAGGIVGDGSNSIVRSGGKLETSFIENAFVICKGKLELKTNLLTSRIYSHGTIKILSSEGIIAGGEIVCSQSILASHVGRSGGAITKIMAGTDYRGELRLSIRTRRLEKISKLFEQDTAAVAELKKRSPQQLDKKRQDKLANLIKRVARLEDLEKVLKKSVDDAEKNMTHNKEASITVKGTIVTSSEILIGGQRVGLIDDISAVKLVGKRESGSFIIPLAKKK